MPIDTLQSGALTDNPTVNNYTRWVTKALIDNKIMSVYIRIYTGPMFDRRSTALRTDTRKPAYLLISSILRPCIVIVCYAHGFRRIVCSIVLFIRADVRFFDTFNAKYVISRHDVFCEHKWRITLVATSTMFKIHYITLHYITFHYIPLHYITLHFITFHYITLHYIKSHYITLHYITLHYITLHYITLHYITLHYITLQNMLHSLKYSPENFLLMRTRKNAVAK